MADLGVFRAAGFKIKKKYERDAEVAFWFGVNPWGVTAEQKQGLVYNLSRLRSQKVIEEGKYDECDYEAVYELYMNAYDDDSIAREAKIRALENHVDRAIREYNESGVRSSGSFGTLEQTA